MQTEKKMEVLASKLEAAEIRYRLRMDALERLQRELFTIKSRTMSLEEIKKEIEAERRQIFIALGVENPTDAETL